MLVGLLLLVSVGLGIVIDRLYLKSSEEPRTSTHQIRQGGYSLINPLLECEVAQEVLTKQFISFRYKIEETVRVIEARPGIDNISVYFRNLNNGVGIGVNEKEDFSPASLLKVPIMIAYFKQYESNTSYFEQKLLYDDPVDRNVGETVRPKSPMKFGEEYTVRDLVFRMMAFSDNNAMALLVKNLPLDTQDKVFTDLGITIPGVRGTEDFMSVVDNASFFRILFNASYLNKDTSQQALELLTKTSFTDGIRGGVPPGVGVANKFGERLFDGKQQLHDCGIVYFKDSPYLLCIMSRGEDFKRLAASIREISRVVYSEVEKQQVK